MKHLKAKLLASTLALGILFSGVAHAKFIGPNESPNYAKVEDVLRKPIEGEKVSLTGHIIKKIGQTTYIFKDSSGEMPIVISDTVIALYKDFSPKCKITTEAEIVIKSSGKPELVAKSLNIQ